jgi:Domain of Unknown Function (DUF1080)
MTLVRRLALLAAFPLAFSAAVAQEKPKDPPKKEEPKKPARIAVADPKDVKDDADFAVQGEYEGEITLNEGKRKVGAQVVAKGAGTFAVKVLNGGLPGAGWDVKPPLAELTAKRGVKDVAIEGKGWTGSIGGGELALKGDLKIDTKLKKVERKSPTVGAEPPKGAVVLFAKAGDESNWAGGKVVELSDGKFLNNGIKSKQAFGAFTAHVEFRLPWMPNSGGQGRGNSGVYLQDRYECQVLDSFGLKGENNECGGFYTLHKPKVNMCLPPLVWQTYDIEFTPAAFDADGKKTKNGRATIVHNGVKIHDDIEFPKDCPGGKPETAKPGPFQFQNHGDPVVYRNVWVVEVK